MWVVTTDGFYSVVQFDKRKGKKLKVPYRLKDTDPDSWLVVRARVRADLERLKIHDLYIEKTLIGDYGYRAILTREEWADYLLAATYEIDYDSHFKEEASRNRPGRHSIYMDVWSALNRLESESKWYAQYGGYGEYRYGERLTPKHTAGNEPVKSDRTSILHSDDPLDNPILDERGNPFDISGILCVTCGFSPDEGDKLDEDGVCGWCRPMVTIGKQE